MTKSEIILSIKEIRQSIGARLDRMTEDEKEIAVFNAWYNLKALEEELARIDHGRLLRAYNASQNISSSQDFDLL